MALDLSEIDLRLEVVDNDIAALENMEAIFIRKHVQLVKYNRYISASPAIRPHMESYWTMKVTAHPPVGMRSKVGTISNELRACLDELAYRLAVRNDATESQLKAVHFPIMKSESIFRELGIGKRIKMLSAEDQKKIEATHPWRGGNDNLFQLNEIDNMRKHQRLMVCLSQTNGFSPGMVSIGQFAIIGGVAPGKLNQEVRIAVGEDVFGELDFLVGVSFREPDDVKGKRAVELLRSIRSEVKSLIDIFR